MGATLLISGLSVDCGRKAGKHSASGLANEDIFLVLTVASDFRRRQGCRPLLFLLLETHHDFIIKIECL